MTYSLRDLAAPHEVHGDASIRIDTVTEDSRDVAPGALFVAVSGTADDGHRYIPDAVARGAAALIVERAEDARGAGIPFAVVPSSRRALADIAARLHGNPGRELEIIGFTGTFGKTTTSDVVRQLLNAAGRKTAVVGSLGARFDGTAYELKGMTTPSPVLVHRALRKLKDAGADTVVMEVTSHALRLERVHGLRFGGGMLAAIRPGEHTDFHHTYEDYVGAKRLLLNYLEPGAILAYDADNRASTGIARERGDVRAVGFSLRQTRLGRDADEERRAQNLDDRRLLQISDAVLDEHGALISVEGVRLRSALLGRANLRNVALALTFARQYGLRLEDARHALESLVPLRRRMERYDIAGRKVLDDTAGHPESFDAAFEVADLIPAGRIVVAYALRGSRGADINRRNALSLAEHVQTLGARVIVTEAADAVGPLDRVTSEEADAARTAFGDRGVSPVWHETMEGAMRDAAANARSGDLIVLVGAQGMNGGRQALERALGTA